MSFPQVSARDLVLTETPTGNIWTERESEVTWYRSLFDDARMSALPPTESLRLIRSIAAAGGASVYRGHVQAYLDARNKVTTGAVSTAASMVNDVLVSGGVPAGHVFVRATVTQTVTSASPGTTTRTAPTTSPRPSVVAFTPAAWTAFLDRLR